MPVINDVALDLCREAGKATSGETLTQANKAVERAIAEINRRMDSEVLEMRDDFAVTANDRDIELPINAKTVIEIGIYDTVAQQISVTWDETTEREYHLMTSGGSTWPPSPASEWRQFFFLDQGTGGRLRIRPVPLCSENTTLLARFYGKVDDSNADRVGKDILFNGGAVELTSWFKDSIAFRQRKFESGMAHLKRKHASLVHPVRISVHPMVARNNLLGARLVE